MKAHQLINQDSGNTEYYTPIELIEAARSVMGSIYLDPASSVIANERVNASHFFSKEQNGLLYPWFGHVWLNHPFGRDSNPLWIDKLIKHFRGGLIKQFTNITFAATSEKWFQALAKFPQCYLSPRTNYYLADGTVKRGVTKGSVVTYGGPHLDRFAHIFQKFGQVKIPYEMHEAILSDRLTEAA